MPAVFIGHGSPMNALEDNRYTTVGCLAASMPRPRAILCVSAHWFINASAVTAMAEPRHDPRLLRLPSGVVRHALPRAGLSRARERDRRRRRADLDRPRPRQLGTRPRRLERARSDVPGADIPVVQLSLDASKAQQHHFDIGMRLDALRNDGVLVVCSGNIVHNLPMVNPALAEQGFDWAERFDDRVRENLTTGTSDELLGLPSDPDYALAVPTPDHYLPLLYLGGIAEAASARADVIIDGYTYGSLSMTSLVVS